MPQSVARPILCFCGYSLRTSRAVLEIVRMRMRVCMRERMRERMRVRVFTIRLRTVCMQADMRMEGRHAHGRMQTYPTLVCTAMGICVRFS
jgi:hypothetical protein